MSINNDIASSACAVKPTLPAFVRKLRQACEALGFGFFFEEGGCWGMALALYAEFATQGYPANLCVRDIDFVHSFVEAEDVAIDYTGVSAVADLPEFAVHTEESFTAVAKRYGVADDTLADHMASAQSVIALAKRLAARPCYSDDARQLIERRGIKPAVDLLLANFTEHARDTEKVGLVIRDSGRLCIEVEDRTRQYPFSMRARVAIDQRSGEIQHFDGTPSLYCRSGWEAFDATHVGCAPRAEPDCSLYGAPELRSGFH